MKKRVLLTAGRPAIAAAILAAASGGAHPPVAGAHRPAVSGGAHPPATGVHRPAVGSGSAARASPEPPRAALPGRRAPGIPVDRWLVTEPIPVEDPEAALEAGPLAGERSAEFFPDRDVEEGGLYWHLVRRDGATAFDLDERFPDRARPAVAYAHVYVRAATDRTMWLAWQGPECGTTRARWNGHPLRPAEPEDAAVGTKKPPERGMAVRLAGGWNTLLLKLVAGDCPLTFGATLAAHPDSAPVPLRGRIPEGVDPGKIRVQASRPPGVQRVYPAAWISVRLPEEPPLLRWPVGVTELESALDLTVSAWGAPPPELAEGERVTTRREPGDSLPEAAGRGAAGGRAAAGRRGGGPGGAGRDPTRIRREQLRARLLPPLPAPEPAPTSASLEARLGGAKPTLTPELPAPGTEMRIPLAVPFLALRKAALDADGARLLLRWRTEGKERRREVTLRPAPERLLEALHAPIPLTGWAGLAGGTGGTEAGERSAAGIRNRGAAGSREPGETREADLRAIQAAVARGGSLAGEWRVPSALSGFTLELALGESPGRWTVNGTAAEPGAFPVTLCGPCRQDERIALAVVPTEVWRALPRVRVREPGYPGAAAREGVPPAAAWLEALRGGGNRAYLRLSATYGGR